MSRSAPPSGIQGQKLGSAHNHGLPYQSQSNVIYDVIVIGSGAGGSIVADTFVRAGFHTLVLEEGFRLRPVATNAEVDAQTDRVLAGNRYVGWDAQGWAWTTRNLGGGTLFYGAASFRYKDVDFDPSSHLGEDALPTKWPITLNDLEPYYAEVESKLFVDYSGFDCHSRRPPNTLSLPGEYLWKGAMEGGLTPRPTPLAIDRQRCNLCSLCISVQCAQGAKRDALNSYLQPSANDNYLQLLTGVKAVALMQSQPNFVNAVRCIDVETRETCVFYGRYFVVACNAIQTAALLLRSATKYSPTGLGNEHDVVGRGLCMKLSEYSQGDMKVSKRQIEQHPIGYKGAFSTVCVLDHYLDDHCPTGIGGLMCEAKHDNWGMLHGDNLILRVETILADRPLLGNRVRLSNDVDHLGPPRVIIDYTSHPSDLARLHHMINQSANWLRSSAARNIGTTPSNFALGSTHLHETCRAGLDPHTSVLDCDGKLHAIDNVHVADGSYMPYPGGLNPTLTIQANALRIARRIVKNCRESIDHDRTQPST